MGDHEGVVMERLNWFYFIGINRRGPAEPLHRRPTRLGLGGTRRCVLRLELDALRLRLDPLLHREAPFHAVEIDFCKPLQSPPGLAAVEIGARKMRRLGRDGFLALGDSLGCRRNPRLQGLDAARLDLSGLHPAAQRARFLVACDVDNPLLGTKGATAVYAPQKGARSADLVVLEAAMQRWADVVAAENGSRPCGVGDCFM